MVAQRRKPWNSRTDRWGNIRCCTCHRYLLPHQFHYYRDKAGIIRPNSSCRDCGRVRSLRLYNRIASDPDQTRYRQRQEQAERARAKKHAKALAERREFVQLAIRRLQGLGFTTSEIARLCRSSVAIIRTWADGTPDIRCRTERKVARVMRACVDVQRVQPAPNQLNRFHHHPDYFRILASIEGSDE